MSNKILVTDSLFIFDEHIKKLEAAGYEVERLDKPKASEDELCEAVKGKVGYILGGVEEVTEKVIQAADELKVISFTGADWQHFVTAEALVANKGIAVSNTPGATTNAVAEFTLGLILCMARDMIALSSLGATQFKTVTGVQDLRIGIVGLGNIGTKVASLLKTIGVKEVVYWDRNKKEDRERELGIAYVSLEELCNGCDVITSHLSTAAGLILNAELISSTKDTVIFINAGAQPTFDYTAVRQKITSPNSSSRIGLDIHGCPEELKDLPAEKAFYTKSNTGFNTIQTLKIISDMATDSLLNLLQSGNDQYKAN